MKKILMTSTALVIFSAFTCKAENDIFFKYGLGFNQLKQTQYRSQKYTGEIKPKETFPMINFAFGIEFDEKYATELAFDYYFRFSEREKSKDSTIENNIDINTKVSAVMLNGYRKFKINDTSFVFLGGGFGVSHIKDNAEGYANYSGNRYSLDLTHGKAVNRLAKKFTLGIEKKLNNITALQLSYNYYDLGKTKPKIISGEPNIYPRRLKANNVTMSVKFKL